MGKISNPIHNSIKKNKIISNKFYHESLPQVYHLYTENYITSMK